MAIRRNLEYFLGRADGLALKPFMGTVAVATCGIVVMAGVYHEIMMECERGGDNATAPSLCGF